MEGIRQKTVKALIASLMTVVLVLLASCGDRAATQEVTPGGRETAKISKNISEVSPPAVIQQLRDSLEVYQPQVAIASPQTDEVLEDNTVTVRFQVQDLAIFKNPDLGLGPHLHVILDNQPYIAVYNINQPLVLSDLAPGSHTLRVFASRPWHESFKNEGAYAQTTFHVFTKTDDNSPDPNQPLLTYSRPKDNYGAEPILLDFYLTNAPLHLVAQESTEDDIADWRIRCTINGESFVLDRWEPVYLKGFKKGKNWVKLEFLDEQGNPVKNVFNSTVRVITYEPNGKDTLSKIVRGELEAADLRGIVDPNYTAKVPETAPEPTPTLTPLPAPAIAPTVEPTPEKQLEEPIVEPTPSKVEPEKKRGFFNRRRQPKVVEPAPETQQEVTPKVEMPELEPAQSGEPELKEKEPKDTFERSPEPTQTLPEIIESPQPEVIVPTPPEPTSPDAPDIVPSLEPAENFKPKLDFKEIFLPGGGSKSSPPIIKAPPELELPSRYLKKAAPELQPQ